MKPLTRAEAECLLASIDLIWDPETLRERFKGHDRATFWRAVGKLRDVVAGRESGGSITETMARRNAETSHFDPAADVDPPLLNKSGGSDVMAIQAELSAHFRSCPDRRCGQDGKDSMCNVAAEIYGRQLVALGIGR